ncbi:hypothetical protein [Gracilimonas mengyeensis]|uniref:DUF4402 domain-containing protein n=1 Tax=Gracilimonas mengyeensis TaxID=1302730 RepID=A0A521EXX0_9BACT|nr:hypothetical protein [Gracilimonas mengyeensis]SMO88745.1 hypothetical protein SAMN06265219_11432 [Gracilimonas mengyeensis]
MKTLKTILSAFALAAILSTGALAQQAIVNASANVLNVLQVSGSDIVFGDVDNNTNAYIQAGFTGETASSNTGSDTPGAVSISQGANNTTVEIVWNTDVVLSDGTNTINFQPVLSHNSTEKAGAGGGTSKTASLSLDGSGEATISIGGSLSSAGAIAGSYSTSNAGGTALTVTVSY